MTPPTADPPTGITAAFAELRRIADSPLAAASPMPPAMYHDEEILELEQQRLFAHDWVCPGLAAEIPNPGDHLTYTIGDQPVFCIRGVDGRIRTLSNVCRHRMMQLVEGRGTARRIVCPYHAWSYDLDGRLVAANHMEHTDGFDKADHCLPEIRTEVWHGWIYVTLNPDAPPVADLLAPLDPLVARYGVADYIPVHTTDHVWDANWKLVVENFMEGYHLPVAHRETLGTWMPIDSTVFPDQRHPAFTYQTFTKDDRSLYGRAHPDNTSLDGHWRHTTVMPTVFPSHMYILAPDHLWYLSLRPKGTSHVDLRFGIAAAPEVHAALDDPEEWVADTVDFFSRVCDEDRAIVERIQQGTRAPLASPGRLSWLEHELHDLMGYLADRLT